jgi:integrase
MTIPPLFAFYNIILKLKVNRFGKLCIGKFWKEVLVMSVYQDKKRNTWYFRIRKKNIHGDTKEITRRGFATKSEAKSEEAKELLREVEPTRFIKLDLLYKSYYNYSKSRLKERTLNIINNRVNTHILPHFKDKLIDKITTNDILKWQELLNSKNYSYEYKSVLYTTFSTIINHAIKYHSLQKNVLKIVGNFKNHSDIKKEMQFFTKEEFDEFIQYENDIVYKTFFITLYYTGLRLGEALALTWKDYYNESLDIKKSLSNKVKDKPYIITTPKTKSSIRSVLLPKCDIMYLDKLKKHYSNFDGFNDTWFIFGGVRPLSETSIRRHKIDACKKTKSKKEIRIHDFRHSHASLLISLGADILYISKRLGHSDIAETLNTYSHLYPSKQKEIIDLLDKI